jgi:hypothetical protein
MIQYEGSAVRLVVSHQDEAPPHPITPITGEVSVALAGGPEGYRDEEHLHRDTEPQVCGRLAAKGHTSACGVNIGRQDG